MRLEDLDKTERSCLCYLETCAVDQSGLVEAVKMNQEDMNAIEKFKAAGFLVFHRIPASMLRHRARRDYTNWVRLTEAGWEMAAKCRRLRAEQITPLAQGVIDGLRELGKID